MSARVMITGASGFIGRELARRLVGEGTEVVGVDLRPPAEPVPGVRHVDGDVRTRGPWQEAAAGCGVVVHAAAIVGMPSDTSAFHAVNVVGTRNALDAARRAGAERFVLVSSVVTFGLDFPDGVGEDHPVQPTGVPYTDTKIAAEQVVLMAHAAGEQEVVVVRPGDVYGPGSQPWTVQVIAELRGRRVLLPAMGRGVFSPVYVDDLVGGLAAATGAPAAAGRVITLSGGVGVPTRTYFGRYARMLGRRDVPVAPTGVARAAAAAVVRAQRLRGRDVEVTPDAVDYLGRRRGTYSVARAAELLDWRPRTPLQTGLDTTERWLRERGLLD